MATVTATPVAAPLPSRNQFLLVTAVMIAVALTSHHGLTGVRAQFRNFRNRKKSESRAARRRGGP